MPKDTKSLGNNKAPACESRGFVLKKKKVRILTHLHFILSLFFALISGASEEILGIYYKKLTKCLFNPKNSFTFAPRKTDLSGV